LEWNWYTKNKLLYDFSPRNQGPSKSRKVFCKTDVHRMKEEKDKEVMRLVDPSLV
jgi:hypothetical protein